MDWARLEMGFGCRFPICCVKPSDKLDGAIPSDRRAGANRAEGRRNSMKQMTQTDKMRQLHERLGDREQLLQATFEFDQFFPSESSLFSRLEKGSNSVVQSENNGVTKLSDFF